MDNKYTRTNMSGMGRDELIQIVLNLQSDVNDITSSIVETMKIHAQVMNAAKDAMEVVQRHHDAMHATCTEAQRTGTAQLEELRLYRAADFPAWVGLMSEHVGTTKQENGKVNAAQLTEALAAVVRDVYVNKGDGVTPGYRLAALAIRVTRGEHERP